MKVLAFLVTFLLIQSLSAILLDDHATQQPRFRIHPGKYVISKSSLQGSKGTHVDFTFRKISFHRGCNNHLNSYKSDGHHFSVGEHWMSTYKGCKTAQHQLDDAIVNLINEADNIRSTHPSQVTFYNGIKWLFTITRK